MSSAAGGAFSTGRSSRLRARVRLSRFPLRRGNCRHLFSLCRCFAAVWLSLTGVVSSQAVIGNAAPGFNETGTPRFEMYSLDDLGLESSPLDLKILPDGRVLVVGASELSVGDGFRWQVIPHSRSQTGFLSGQVAVGPDGTLFVSGTQGFARIAFDTRGGWYLENRVAEASDQFHAFTANTRIGHRWLWFDNGVVEWDPTGGAAPRTIVPDFSLLHLFGLGADLYLPHSIMGSLQALEPNGRIRTVLPAEGADPGRSIICSAPLDEAHVLVGTTNKGVFVFDGAVLRPLANRGVLSGGRRINDLCATTEGRFAAAVEGVGVVFFDRKGNTLQILDSSSDYRLAQLRRLVWDPVGLLWGFSAKGVVRAMYPSRVSLFDNLINHSTDYVSPVRHAGLLWLLATGTVLEARYDEELRLGGFVENTPPTEFVFWLGSAEGRLLAGALDGLWELRNTGWTLAVPGVSNLRVTQPTAMPGRWLYVARDEIGWIDFQPTGIQLSRHRQAGLGEVYNTCSADADTCWLELGAGRAGRVSLAGEEPRLDIFGAAHGIASGWVELFVIDGVVRAQCSGRTLRFDAATEHFEPDTAFASLVPEVRTVIGGRTAVDARGRIWVPEADRVRVFARTGAAAAPSVELIPADLKPGYFLSQPDGVVWMQGRLCFARYDPAEPLPRGGELRALITKVELPGSGRTLLSPPTDLGRVRHTDNALTAYFAATGGIPGEKVAIEVQMTSLGGQWTPVGISGSASFSHLAAGRHELRVRPRLDAGVGTEALVVVEVLPPWHRTASAYTVYGAVVALAIGLAIWLPLVIERRQKERLSRMVAERTGELRASEERYRRLNAELEGRVAARTADLDHAAAQLSAANRELESFAYSISHDLKAPLRNIMGFTQLLERKAAAVVDKDGRHYMEVIIAETKRLGTLIGDLLQFSRIGKTSMRLAAVDLGQIVAAVRAEMAVDLGAREIEWHIGPLSPVSGDRALLHQVMANLVANAVKFTRRRARAVIEVEQVPAPRRDGLLTFVVRDNGAGFNPRYAEKLFGVFQRLHSEKEYEGTGIGLANVKRIISRHGGEVWAESALDRGAAFFFTLRPATAAESGPEGEGRDH